MKTADLRAYSSGGSEAFLLLIAPSASEGARTEALGQLLEEWSRVSERQAEAPPNSLGQCATELATRLLDVLVARRADDAVVTEERLATGHRVRGLKGGCVALVLGQKRTSAPVPQLWAKQLTPREFEVVTYVVEGLPNQWIADELGIATATVKRHVSNSFDKLGCDSRAQLIARARGT